MTAALRVLTPNVRLYGLAVYALTATFTPALAATVAALWTDIVDWRFVFWQTIPLCSLAGVLVWYCLHQDQPRYERFRMLDWRGALLLVIGTGALSTVLYQGDRLDWFNSTLICLLALVSALAIPLFLINEWFHPLPLLKLQMLGRRNFAYGALGLFTFLVISQSGSSVPLRYLQEVQGYRPLQSNLITLEIAASQLLMLPAMALLLDYKRIDSRVVSLVGLGLILASCIGSSFLTVYWNRDQFYLWQLLQAVGQPMVIMPLLMMSTNTVAGPAEGPFAAALINTSRAVAEATSAWFLALIDRWRNALHSDRIIDEVGQDRWRVIQSKGVLPQYPPPLTPDGQPRVPNSLEAFSHAVQQQGNDFIDQRHLPDPRSPDRVLDGGRDDVTGPHPAAAYPVCKAPGDPDGRGHNRTREATRRAEAKRKAGPYPDAQERRSTSTEGWNVEGPASPGRR